MAKGMLGSFTRLPRLVWPGKANLASLSKPNWLSHESKEIACPHKLRENSCPLTGHTSPSSS